MWLCPDVSQYEKRSNTLTSFGYLEALKAGYLVEYTVGELAFWTVVAAIVKQSELAAMLAERLAQIEERCRLMSEAMPILS